jgi:dipeptidyl aminopeptidase/acylaminoacyl peptidase
MRLRTRVSVAIFSLFPVTLGFAHLAAQDEPQQAKKPIAVEDLYLLDQPTAAVLSPDGKRLAYIRRWIDNKRERQSLWLVDAATGKAEAMEKGEPDARAPVFSPDGHWIAFLSARPRPEGWKQTPGVPVASDPATDIWLIGVLSGPAVSLAGADKPYGRVLNDGFYGRLAFSPDSRKLAFVADDGKDPRTAEEIANDVEIVRPDQGEGYTGYGATQVWVADLDPQLWNHEQNVQNAARRIGRLTKDDVWYGDPQWSPDGKTLVVHANRTDDRESARFSINKNFDLWAIDVATHKLTQLTTGPGPEVFPRFSPDGKRLLCLSVPRKGSHRDSFNLMLVTLGDGSVRTEVLFDHHAPGAGSPSHPPPSAPLPQDCWDGNDHVVYSVARRTESVGVRVSLQTKLVSAPKDDKPGTDSPLGRIRLRQKLTPPGNAVLKQRHLAETRVVLWENEGLPLDGLLTVPPESVAKPPYKLIVYPHGGPHGRATDAFNFSVQVFAGQGYAVFQPNFRGSEGYGQKFIDADRFDFGGGDMRDILSGIDELVKQKVVDKDRQFVYGTSYGGFMTTWLVGHTTQFRAAVAQNAVTDLNAMWGLSDLQSWTEWEFGGRPWEVAGAMRQHSPLTYAANVKTPTLILHARDDRRCPLPMGRMFHQALRANKVPTQMVIYPDEGHGIRQPRHQEDVLRRVLAWFAEYDRK